MPETAEPQVAAVDDAVERLERFIRVTLGHVGEVPLHSPEFAARDWESVKDTLDSGWVSSVGAYVGRFEEMAAAACETDHAVATVNGTAALHVALKLVGVGGGDLVLCPALTFIGTANAISQCGAQPLFVDSDPQGLGIDASRLADFIAASCEVTPSGLRHRDSGARIAAAVAVHVFGHPVDMDGLLPLCAEYALPVVEDAAEALGSRYKGRRAGGLARIGVLSFNGNKIVTTGGGGMIVTGDGDLAARAKHLTTTARRPHRWAYDHDEVGFNYRLPNLNAALGCAQMERLDGLLARKRALAARYADLFDGLDGVDFLGEPEWAESNYWLNAVLLGGPDARDRFLDRTNARGIATRPCWTLLSDVAAYRGAPVADDLAGARSVAARLVNLPSSAWLLAAEGGDA